jgi:hypothetical protein
MAKDRDETYEYGKVEVSGDLDKRLSMEQLRLSLGFHPWHNRA